jgi:demethylmenaquinone methyltransferase/2-methoxy-6-polyprenyl-1,4-benzoquinol methylase
VPDVPGRPNPADAQEPAQIQLMFSRLARRYDRANHLLSLGTDIHWRRRAVAAARVQPGEMALDVCAGTGDLSVLLARAGARVVGADFCRPMLDLAQQKVRGADSPRFVSADALCLPFAAGSFDLVTAAFGVRNLADPEAGLREMARVLRPGGRVLILEFCKPRLPLVGPIFRFYFRCVLPTLGSWISGDRQGAYAYLHKSVLAFPEREQFSALMQRAGLHAPSFQLLTGGVAALYLATVSA